MQHPVMLRFGHAVARDIGVRIKRDRGGGFVGDAVGHGEHVLVVDGDDAREDEALAIVPLAVSPDGRATACRLSLLPRRIIGRHRRVAAGGADPTEDGVIGIVGALAARAARSPGLLGSMVSRYFFRRRSSKRAPLSRSEPSTHRRVDGHAGPALFQCCFARHDGLRRWRACTWSAEFAACFFS